MILARQPRLLHVALEHDLDNHVNDLMVRALLADLEDGHSLLAIAGIELVGHGLCVLEKGSDRWTTRDDRTDEIATP